MGLYVWRRLLALVPVLVGISIIAFALGVLAPGDPAEIALNRSGLYTPTPEQIAQVRSELGLDRPLVVQYGHWFQNLLRGDLGTSYTNGRPVAGELLRRLPLTLQLAGSAFMLTCFSGLFFGTLAVVFHREWPDRLINLMVNLLLSFPGFWLALLLILVLAENRSLLPTSGTGTLAHFVMPTLTLSAATSAIAIRLTRASLLQEMGKPYMLAARAKGLHRFRLVATNALPNALPPVMALLGNYLGGILGGSVVIESIFALPGIGSYAIEAIFTRDYPALQGYVLITGTFYVLVMLLVDLLSVMLNPRVRLGGASSHG
ncbi:peptide/nickel transport system permease protein [Anoxynatronum buryatiense]|uniref:Peptide/nickel transport system permease protein n=2 Tax=Anoxynatronum TaxID=210622 RepID=A0AA45WUZ0_9CLOT|nr:peptide/nickel transport system permease protein [Anoxynatronum buryatiense]